MREPLAVTLAASIATLPIIVTTFQTLSIASLPANLLVAELVLPMTWLGAALAMAAPVPYLGAILALPTLGLASLLVGIVDWLAQAPGAAVATGRPSVLFAVLWYAMLGCWVGAGSADVRALGLRPPILRVGAVVAAVLALVVAVVPLGQSDAVEVSLLDVAAGAAFVRTPGGRTAVLVTADDAPGLRASVGQRLRGLVERPEILVAPTDAGAVADLLARYPPSTSLLGSGSEIAPGTQVDVGDGAIVEVVDVRQVDERLVLDLLVLVDDLAIWLPGPGRPSARWADAPAGRALLRLPTTAAAWLRDPTPRSWLAIVGQTPRTDVPPELGAVFLDQRSLGAVEVRLAAGDLTVLTERCEGSAGCEVMISQAE
jgi:hypothetical protein